VIMLASLAILLLNVVAYRSLIVLLKAGQDASPSQ
jgi:hypothetical protein